MYILDDFSYKIRTYLSINIEGEFECIVAEIQTKNAKKNLLLAEVYIIPNTPVWESLSRYDDLMNKLVECDIMLATDQNIDYCKVDRDMYL